MSCTSAKILERKRQLCLANDALEEEKEEFAKKMEGFKRREEILEQKKISLQESNLKFKKFLQENESKRTRAMRRSADDTRLCESTDREIERLQKILEEKNEEERILSQSVKQNKKYKDYLKKVVEEVQTSSGDFSEIQDILDRYATLKNTNDDLLSQMQANTRGHDTRRTNYAQFMKKSGNEMLNMNNEIARLQKELERATIELNKMESLDSGSSRHANELTTEISQALLVIDNMSDRLEFHAHPSLHDKKKNPIKNVEGGIEIKVKNAVGKLQGITNRIIDYGSIADEWEEEMKSKLVQKVH